MQVGFGCADITPPVGKEVPGGFSKAYSETVHDPLYAAAMVIEAEDTRVALVGVDVLSVKGVVVREARREIEERTGIPGSHVMIGASHTHRGGPAVGALPGDFSRASAPEFCEHLARECATAADPDYARVLGEKIATAVILADQGKREAGLAVGVGHEDSVAFNRRFRMKDGTQTTHPGKGNPDIVESAGPIDPDVGVLSAWAPDGEFLGCLVNYTCHGTTMGPGLSADWIYYLRRTITGALNPEATVVFLNGACGDVTQVDNLSTRKNEFGEIVGRRVGQTVGAEALKVMAEVYPTELGPLAAAQATVRISTREISDERAREALEHVKSDAPRDHEWWFARDVVLLHEQNRWEPEVEAELQAIQVGPLAVVSNPAEYFCEFGLDIKRRSNFPHTFVVELANGCIGYVPTEEAMGPHGGGYEPRLAMSSKLVPEAGEMIVDASVELVNDLAPGELPEEPQVDQTGTPWGMGSSSAKTV